MEEDPILLQLILIIILISLSAFFSASETALTSLSQLKRKKMETEHSSSYKTIDKLLKNPGKMLATILVGNNIVNVLASTVSTLIFIQLMKNLSINNEILITISSAFFITVLLLIFGEITPKTVALNKTELVSIFVCKIIYFLTILFTPLIFLIGLLSKPIIKFLGGSNLEKNSLFTEKELKSAINIGVEEGLLEVEEEKMLHSIIEFGDIIVREIMTPRTAIVAIDVKTPYNKILECIKEYGHSRIPVYSEKMDNIIGVLYAKDLLLLSDNDIAHKDFINKVMRPPFFVPETKKIDELLNEMKNKKKNHIAIVVDEYGGTSGIVTIEDIIEEIIGEIKDEYDNNEEEQLIQTDSNTFIVSGLLNMSDLNNELGINLPEDDDYDSIAGFMVNKLGKMPSKGDVFENEKVRITILNVLKRRITKLQIQLKTEGEDNNG